jgi:hypothetical protein
MVVYQGFTVICKREGNNASSRDPTANAAKNKAVPHWLTGGRCGQRQRLVAVGSRQRFKPTVLMERRCSVVARNQIVPARIGERICEIRIHSLQVHACFHQNMTSAGRLVCYAAYI